MNKYLIVIITLFITYDCAFFAMESLPLILTPYIPVPLSDKEPEKYSQIYVSDDATMYFQILPSGTMNTQSRQNKSILFKEQSFNSSTLRTSTKDSSYNIFSNQGQDCNINDGNFQLTVSQIEALRNQINHAVSVIVWNGKQRYDISRLASTDQSLTEQCIVQNQAYLTTLNNNHRLTQEIIDLLNENKQLKTELSNLKPGSLGRHFIYDNKTAKIVSTETFSLQELKKKNERKDGDPENLSSTHFEDMAKNLSANRAIRLEQEFRRKPAIYKVFGVFCIIGIPIAIAWWLFFSKNRA